MVRPKADEPAHAGRVLLNTNFYAVNEYPATAVRKVTGWKARYCLISEHTHNTHAHIIIQHHAPKT